MPSQRDRKSLLIIISVFLFVIVSTYLVGLLARGYRPSLGPGSLTLNATGLLSATSLPKSASVYINSTLITATDDTINLIPGNYQIKIIKDGYFSWQKNFQIKPEIVYQTNAHLFRTTPDLRPLTQIGAINPVISPDNSQIIFSVASASASHDNGLYILNLTPNPLNLSKNVARQLSPNSTNLNWSDAQYTFSPTSQDIIAFFPKTGLHLLLDLTATINPHNLPDVSPRLTSIYANWQTQTEQIIRSKLSPLPNQISSLVSTASANHILTSTDDTKILYLAAKDGLLPDHFIPAPPAQSTQPQNRQISKDNYYVYDSKDDTNYLIGSKTAISQPFWLPNSASLIFVQNQSVMAIDYDATNKITLFISNITPTLAFPSNDDTKITVLTSAYTGSLPNLYSVTIK